VWLGGIGFTIWAAVKALRARSDPHFAWIGVALAIAAIVAVFVG